MLKAEFVKKVKEALELNSIKATEDMLDKFTTLVADLVKAGEEVQLGTLGKFVVTESAPRKGHNPRTGEAMDIPAKKVLKFKTSGAFKKNLNDK
jgi:DNA-binding protein HU-beta